MSAREEASAHLREQTERIIDEEVAGVVRNGLMGGIARMEVRLVCTWLVVLEHLAKERAA